MQESHWYGYFTLYLPAISGQLLYLNFKMSTVADTLLGNNAVLIDFIDRYDHFNSFVLKKLRMVESGEFYWLFHVQ